MKKTLLVAAVLGLSVGGAYACPYSKSVEADAKMTVASVDQKATSKPDNTVTGSVTTETKSEKSEN